MDNSGIGSRFAFAWFHAALGRLENQANKSSSHAVYSLKLHIVFVTKYRRKTLTPELLDYLREAFAEILEGWRCTLLEFGGEADHVHLLVEITTVRRFDPDLIVTD